MARIDPVNPPYDEATRAQLDSMMPPGADPILLFRTFAKNLPMTAGMETWGRYELSPNMSLTMRDREILIDRTCARCRCEYEWGVHVAFFAGRVRLSRDQVASITHGGSHDECWTNDRDRLLIRVADALHDTATTDDDLHDELKAEFTEHELLDLYLLCGWYHAISFAANSADVAHEPGAPRFSDYQTRRPHCAGPPPSRRRR